MSEASWARLVASAGDDPAAIGLVLTGGRGKGLTTEWSDWDGLLVVADPVVERWRAEAPDDLDLTILGAGDWVSYAEPFTPFAWRGYDLARLTPALDRGGFQMTLDRKGRLAETPARRIAEEAIGVGLNQLYRATKDARDGNAVATALDLVETVPAFLTAFFALEGRHRPYNKLLEWELGVEPLAAISSDDLVRGIRAIIEGVDLGSAWQLEEWLEKAARHAGVIEELTGWEDHLAQVRPAATTASRDRPSV